MEKQNDAIRILLTNDDGIHAAGLWALYEVLARDYAVTVVAPDRERSAVSHGITLHSPLRVTQVTVNGGYRGWSVNGTPADCVKLAMIELLPDRPDLVVSGINPGANVGVNMHYSGTVAAAKEAALYGIKALAVSIEQAETVHYDAAAGFIRRLVPELRDRSLPPGTFLNINVPNVPSERIAGARLSRQGNDVYDEYFEKRRDPRNRIYYWQGSEGHPRYSSDDIDGALLSANYIAITPVQCDMTDINALKLLKTWGLERRRTPADTAAPPRAHPCPRED